MIDLSSSAKSLCAVPKGILAADESDGTCDKRFAAQGIEQTDEMRRAYRDLLLSTPGVEEYISGVILYKGTLEQNANDGTSFAASLLSRGIVPGIKVDEGTEPMPESADELITKGLLGLSERLHGYRDAHKTGFTKWRAVVTIDGDRLPTSAAVVENAKRLAMYARCVQEAGMVPMLEPEVLYDGMHSRMRSRAVITEAVSALMQALGEHGVDPSGVILKTSMALSGKGTGRIDSPEDVAEDTLGALLQAVPAVVPGIVFLSGGQTPDQATDNLRAIAQLAKAKNAPWPLTFSFSRALQEEALALWKGKEENVPAARAAFLSRLDKVSKAAAGL
ncbi:MAG TPA: fructose-bisphosphate aldolase class I [Candidatus Paceibacterota bacterium]|nr:fructose-bisphosphate aldolase class I [Candidatus Paceibacterota bacterium]